MAKVALDAYKVDKNKSRMKKELIIQMGETSGKGWGMNSL